MDFIELKIEKNMLKVIYFLFFVFNHDLYIFICKSYFFLQNVFLNLITDML